MSRVAFALFGSHGAGKTALVNRLYNNTFVKCLRSPLDSLYNLWKKINIDYGLKADILEYSGSYYITRTTIMPAVHGIIIVFGVENRLTYKTALAILAKIVCYYKQTYIAMPPILLYGTKTDVIGERKVTAEEVFAFLAENQYSNVKYKETSLKLNDKRFVTNDIITAFNL